MSKSTTLAPSNNSTLSFSKGDTRLDLCISPHIADAAIALCANEKIPAEMKNTCLHFISQEMDKNRLIILGVSTVFVIGMCAVAYFNSNVPEKQRLKSRKA